MSFKPILITFTQADTQWIMGPQIDNQTKFAKGALINYITMYLFDIFCLYLTNRSQLTLKTSSHALPFIYLSGGLPERMSISTEAGRTHFFECNGLKPIINDHPSTSDGFLYVKHFVVGITLQTVRII